MSLFPVYIEYERPRQMQRHHLLNKYHSGHSLEDILSSLILSEHNRNCLRNWKKHSEEIGSTIKEDKNNFQVNLDVQHFAPEEITVRTADGFLVVEAKHEEKQDQHGFISRSFTRRYALPETVDPDAVLSRLSSDGVLSITAPLEPTQSTERIVPIVQTGPVKKVENETK